MKQNDSYIYEWPIQEIKSRVIGLLTEIVCKSAHIVLDPTMALVYELARSLGSIHLFPQSLQNVTFRAALVNHIDINVIANTPIWARNVYPDNLPIFLNRTAIESYSYIPDVSDMKDRVNISLRLWVGCIEAAKMIRFTSVIKSNEYSFGKVSFERIRTAEDRRTESLHINSLASMDSMPIVALILNHLKWKQKRGSKSLKIAFIDY